MRILFASLFTVCLLAAQPYVRVSPSAPQYLELSNGQVYVPIGLNIAWERFATDEEEVFALTEKRFRLLAENGGNFARVWLSHPFYQLDPVTPGVIEQSRLRRIDRLLAIARKHGIRVKLCLEHFRTVREDPSRFPGSVAMGLPHYGQVFKTMTEYFETPAGRAVFLAKLDALATRYANEPIIFGWELWNEINAVREPGAEAWTRAMLPELKKRFPRHLAMQSLGSFDSDAKAVLYRLFTTMPGNELAQAHRYLDEGAALPVCHGPMDVLSADAVTALRDNAAAKPVLLSEVGAVEPKHAGPFRLYAKDRDGVLLHDGLFAPFFAGSAGGGQFWHWQDYVEPNSLWWQFARFAEAIQGVDPRAEQFVPERRDTPQVRVYALIGKNTTMLWVRDKASGWRAELVEGKAARTLQGVTLPWTASSARVFDPWKNRWQTLLSHDGKITLPPFKRSLVVR